MMTLVRTFDWPWALEPCRTLPSTSRQRRIDEEVLKVYLIVR